MSGHEDMAEATVKESIKLSRAAKDRHVEAVALNNLGSLYSYRNKLDDFGLVIRLSPKNVKIGP